MMIKMTMKKKNALRFHWNFEYLQKSQMKSVLQLKAIRKVHLAMETEPEKLTQKKSVKEKMTMKKMKKTQISSRDGVPV